MQGKYLGEIVQGNRLMFNKTLPYLNVNFGSYGNYGNIGNYGNPRNYGSIGILGGYRDVTL
jgi:hypothetical protein